MTSRTIPNVGRRRTLRTVTGFSFLIAICLTSGCVGHYTLAARRTAGVGGVSWFAPDDNREGAVLERWRGSVGPPIFSAHPSTPADAGTLTVVSWNTALGAGDVERLVTDIKNDRPGVPIVLLLQEVYRGGPEVPALLTKSAAFASPIRGRRADGRRDEVEAIAAALDMSVYLRAVDAEWQSPAL